MGRKFVELAEDPQIY